MYEFNTTITDEGAILLTRIIEWHEYATFKKLWFSENNYVGQEPTLTADTFGGVFATENVSASIIDNTTIKISAAIFSPAQDDTLYSIGVIMDDNGTNVLVAVCTTSDPMPISQGAGNRFAFNINLTVSSTSDITVVGTTAAVLYDTDIVDNLTTADATKVLSANMGVKIADNLAANENVYGAKNQFEVTALSQTVNDVIFTINADKSITTSGQANAETCLVIGEKKYTAGTYTLTGSSGLSNQYMYGYNVDTAETYVDTGSGVTFTLASENTIRFLIYVQSGASATETYYPMLCDARITDPTFVPFAETNLQLTQKTSGLSNHNFLDNPFFTVNQRGATTVTSIEYGADRWKMTGGTSLTFSDGQVVMTSALCVQFFDKHIPNGIYTASVKLADGTIYHGTAEKINDTDEINFIYNNTFRLVYNYGGNGDKSLVIDNANVGMGTITVKAVKLEVGSVSTLHLDVAPDYTTELLKCQRYLAPAGWCVVTKNSNNVYVGTVKLPVPLRDTPTIPTPTLTDALWCPSSGYFTPDTVSTSVRDTYKNTTISFSFTGSALTEPCYVYDSGVLVSAEL